MKLPTLTLLLSTLFLFSCNKDDDNQSQEESHEFRDSLLGWYRLEAAFTDIPLDLNYDGIKNTNLLEEVSYCNNSLLLESYKSLFIYRETNFGDQLEISMDIPYSKYILELEAQSSCLFNYNQFYEYKVNEATEEIDITYTYPEFEDRYKIWIQEISWEDEVAYFTFKKEFYTSEETWEEVTLYMEFRLDPTNGNN